jgi:PAS domain S-box-containing protein
MPDDLLEPPVPYRTLIEHLPVVVYIASDDPTPRTLYIGPNVEQMLGHPPSVFLAIGEDWTSMMHPDDVGEMHARFAATAASGEPFQMEYRFIHPDGRVVWVRDHAMPFVDPTGGERVWQGVLEDISARVAAEERGDASEIRYETLLENLPAVVYEMVPDDDRRTHYVNRKIEELLGYTMEEWLDQPDMWMEVLHPDDREPELAAHDLHSATGDPWQREYRLIDARGSIVWVRDQATLVRDANGKPSRWQGVMVDITAEKEAQRALQRAHDELEFRVRARTAQLVQANEAMGREIAERERAEQERDRAATRLGQILENVPAVVYLWQMREREDGQWFTYVGEQIAPMLGYTADEWADDGWRARVHPHDRERVEAAAERSIELGEPFQMEYRYLARDGHVVWVLDRATLVLRNDSGQPLLFEGVMVDITGQREAESAAETASDQLRELVERGPSVLLAYTIDTWDPPIPDIQYLSPRIGDLLSTTPSSWIDDPRRWFGLIHPDDRDAVIRAVEHAWSSGTEWSTEYRVLDADGSIVWIWERGRCVARDPNGRPFRFLASLVDVTDRRREADELARRLDTLDAVAEGIPGVLWTEVTDPTIGGSRYTYLSSGSVALTGYSPEELMAERRHMDRVIHPDDAGRVAALDELADLTGTWDATYRITHRDGGIRWIHSLGRREPSPGPQGIVWHGVTVDVTAQMEASQTRTEGAPATGLEAPTELSPPV